MHKGLVGRHSLVTPIDWKPLRSVLREAPNVLQGRHSLVTPIDWKLHVAFGCEFHCLVAILW